MDSPPELFLKYHYAESKDLLKSFLTLLSATLVLSIAFAEKIVEVKTLSKPAKACLIASWIALILAIIFSGLSICANALAGGAALSNLYANEAKSIPSEVWERAQYSIQFALVAGASFVFGLAFMIFAAVLSMRSRSA